MTADHEKIYKSNAEVADFQSSFSGLFRLYIERSEEARRANLNKLESEVDKLIKKLTFNMQRIRDAVLKELERGE